MQEASLSDKLCFDSLKLRGTPKTHGTAITWKHSDAAGWVTPYRMVKTHEMTQWEIRSQAPKLYDGYGEGSQTRRKWVIDL